MSETTCVYAVKGGVAHVTFNRPAGAQRDDLGDV